MTEKTEDQIAAEKAAADQAAKEAKKAEAAAKRDAAKAERAEKAAAAKIERAEKAAAAKAEKDAKKAEAKAALEAVKQPESNGVRRPKPETLCGKAWAVFDEISAKNGTPASISQSLEAARTMGLNEGNVKAEYARWRKFFGVTGRVMDPTKVPAPAAETPAAE